MDHPTRFRVVGEYTIGPRIGSGSFAVVYRSKHRQLGTEFAIKEIDKKHLNDHLFKEISILRNISHPNIIRLFDAIQTDEKIYLVMEYCNGGDLWQYINKHGRVSEDVARHFMNQLAAGLQVLRENHLIHRDLKPQNLLLSGKEVTPSLKIGDFGFARYLTPQGLADTLCGSPLYMAPEIIQNQRYDAKADLWSVGAILYQLVIGKPPFDGNSQLELFQNIISSTEPQFPEGALKVLDPDFVELCRSLLRRNPVERIAFKEFFNHRFMMKPRGEVDAESSSQISQVGSLLLTDSQRHQLYHDKELKASEESRKQDCSSVNDDGREFQKGHYSASSSSGAHGVVPDTFSDKSEQSFKGTTLFSDKSTVVDSLESIEKGYVLVHSDFASKEILTSSLGTSLKGNFATRACALAPTHDEQQMIAPENTSFSRLVQSIASDAPSILKEAHGLSILHPSTRLQLLHQYVVALSDLAREKLDEGLFLESFSVELVVLAVWKEAINICNSWLSSSGGSYLPGSSGNETAGKGVVSSSGTEDATNFTEPSSVSIWAKQGFVVACDRTEKLSKYLKDVDAAAAMPDAMEIIFQTALGAGRIGAADQLIGNRGSAVKMYSRALILLSFIAEEAPSLSLNPPFTLAPDNKQRILKYIKNLESHVNHSQMPEPSLKQLPDFVTR